MSQDIYTDFENKSYAKIHPSNRIHPTAVIHDNVELGVGNVIGAYTVIGSNGEIRGAKDFQGTIRIGDNNVISENVTIQRPYAKNRQTIIGDDNIIMAHSHVGHDVYIGNNCEICSGTILGGYCRIYDKVKLKIGVLIRNRKEIGHNTIVGMGSVVTKDIKPNKTVVGNPAKELNK